MINFLHTYLPNPVLLDLGIIKIHWYGFLITLGIILGFIIIVNLAKKYQIEKNKIYDLAFWVLLVGLIFDRLYYVIYAWDYYQDNLLDIFKIWQGGLAIHGGIIGGFLALYLFSKKYKLNWRLLTDLVIVALFLGLAIGRFGNYFNQELFGYPTDLAWGIPIAQEHRPLEFQTNQYFHPTFIYESLLDLTALAILLGLHFWRFKGKKYISGNIAIYGIIFYGIIRFFTEFYRIDYTPILYPLRTAQLASLVLIVLGIILFIFNFKYNKKEQLNSNL